MTQNLYYSVGLFAILHVATAPPASPVPLTVALGEHSPDVLATLFVARQTGPHPVLQVRLDTGTESVSITEMTVLLTVPPGQPKVVDGLQVLVLRDGHGAGQIDVTAPSLAAAMVLNLVDPIRLSVTPPLHLQPHTTTHV